MIKLGTAPRPLIGLIGDRNNSPHPLAFDTMSPGHPLRGISVTATAVFSVKKSLGRKAQDIWAVVSNLARNELLPCEIAWAYFKAGERHGLMQRGGRYRKRQREPKPRPHSEFRDHGDFSAMAFDEFLRDSQAKASALLAFGRANAALMELAKNIR